MVSAGFAPPTWLLAIPQLLVGASSAGHPLSYELFIFVGLQETPNDENVEDYYGGGIAKSKRPHYAHVVFHHANVKDPRLCGSVADIYGYDQYAKSEADWEMSNNSCYVDETPFWPGF